MLQDLRESDVKQDVMLKMDSGAEAIEGVVHNNEFTEKLFGKSLDEVLARGVLLVRLFVMASF